jgi:glycosyltransferase involved in cell wall biosynthesis
MMEAGVHGLWVHPGDVAGLADALVRLASDAALRLRLATAARERVLASNGVESVIDGLLRIYAGLSAIDDARTP